MIKYYFTKMNGAGNDFIMVDLDQNSGLQFNADDVRRLCDRRFGIGADGLIAVNKHHELDFAMDYYNADGSKGMLCGNGARCAVRFYGVQSNKEAGKFSFVSNKKNYHAELYTNENVKFYLHPPSEMHKNMKLTVYGQTITAHYVDTGAPHVVVNINDILRTPNDPDSRFRDIVNFPVETIGREIRFHQTFYPTGTNVNFFLLQNGTNFIRTFERGVEAETYACGTGSVATAVILALIYGKTPPVRLVPKSQKILEVNFIRNGDIIRDVSLTGPAEINYRGEFELSAK